MGPNNNTSSSKDPRAVIIAVTGLLAVLVIALAAFHFFPGAVPKDKVDTTGQNIVAIGTAALTVIGAIVAAYFGVKAANVAREDSGKAAERHEIRTAHLAGATDAEAAEAANAKAAEEIEERGL